VNFQYMPKWRFCVGEISRSMNQVLSMSSTETLYNKTLNSTTKRDKNGSHKKRLYRWHLDDNAVPLPLHVIERNVGFRDWMLSTKAEIVCPPANYVEVNMHSALC